MPQDRQAPDAGQHSSGDPQAQRDSLRRSERKAAEQQPGSFKDAETADKIVEIGPDRQNSPIEGLDPAEPSSQRSTEETPSSAGEEDPDAAMDDPGVGEALQDEARRAKKNR